MDLALRPDCRPRSLMRPGLISKSSSLTVAARLLEAMAPEMAENGRLWRSVPASAYGVWLHLARTSAPHDHHSHTLFYLAILLTFPPSRSTFRTILRQSTPACARGRKRQSLHGARRNGREKAAERTGRSRWRSRRTFFDVRTRRCLGRIGSGGKQPALRPCDA